MNTLLTHLLVSICLGSLIGLIRQWSDQQSAATPSAHVDFGGVRTYSLWALLGCLAAFVSQNYIPATLPVVMGLVGAHLVITHVKDSTGLYPGGTSFAASMLTCLVGAMVNWGHTQSATVVAALTMVMLGIKKPLHTWTSNFTAADIRGTLQFVAITGVILPLVPDRAMGPYEAFNPYSIWLMVVLISGVGFLGYVLMRFLGSQAGSAVTGILGGLASSTATTLTFSKRSRDLPELSSDYALAVILACTTMYLRLAAMIGFINPILLQHLAIPFVIMAAPGVLFALYNWIRSRSAKPVEVNPPAIQNPLSLKTSIQFALLYAIAAFVIKIATTLGWQNAVLPLAFLSGLTSTDAMSLLMANNQMDGTTSLHLAGQAIIIAALANTVAKAAITLTLGSRPYKIRTGVALGIMVLTCAASLWLV